MRRSTGHNHSRPNGSHPLPGQHFRDNTGGYHRPSELYYAELVEEDTQWNGYFCQKCLEAFGKKPGKRPSLLKVIKERIEQNQREANDKLTRALRIK